MYFTNDVTSYETSILVAYKLNYIEIGSLILKKTYDGIYIFTFSTSNFSKSSWIYFIITHYISRSS